MKIELEQGQNLFFTSDTHYGHTNMVRGLTTWKYNFRDFNTMYEMNSKIVENINNVVGEDDILFHLGDWSFGGIENILEFRNQIICNNIHLILGNHDEHIRDNKNIYLNSGTYIGYEYLSTQGLFNSVDNYLELEVVYPQNRKDERKERIKFVLCHFPICSWNKMRTGIIHLFGHCHLPKNMKVREGKAMDVGVDGNNLKPYNIHDILKIMNKQPVNNITIKNDHHL